jgi:hypothetical protein
MNRLMIELYVSGDSTMEPSTSFDLTFSLLVGATVAIGLLAGASLDQSIKQLPARYRIGSVAYSQYSRAGDLGNGILFYAILGIGAALLNIAAALAAYLQGIEASRANLIYAGALFALLHSLATTQAAPTNFSQRKIASDDEKALAAIFDKFTKWQNLRCLLQVINFCITLWAVIAYLRV